MSDSVPSESPLQFQLQPCQLHQEHVVPQDNVVLSWMNWRELLVLLEIPPRSTALSTLLRLKDGSFVGALQPDNVLVARPTTIPILFALDGGSSLSVTRRLRSIPRVQERLQKLYKVVGFRKGGSISED